MAHAALGHSPDVVFEALERSWEEQSVFLAYLGIQWWAWRRSDGGGEFVQRMSAARTEDDAAKAAWLVKSLANLKKKTERLKGVTNGA